MQFVELGAPCGRELFGTAGNDLPKLDKGWAEILQHETDSFGGSGGNGGRVTAVEETLEKAAYAGKGAVDHYDLPGPAVFNKELCFFGFGAGIICLDSSGKDQLASRQHIRRRLPGYRLIGF
jgi:hypothetical protein